MSPKKTKSARRGSFRAGHFFYAAWVPGSELGRGVPYQRWTLQDWEGVMAKYWY